MKCGMPYILLLLIGLAALLAEPSHAQPLPGVAVSWAPEQPAQGSLFVVHARGDAASTAVLQGVFADEPLHFERQADGSFRALAAAPIDAPESMPLRIYVADGRGHTDTLRVPVPVARGSYRMERLTVAPRYGREPDPALAARMSSEAERARTVSRRSHDTPRLWDGEFVRPRPGRVTSGFGNGREFNGQVQSRHMGTDFAGAIGAPVHATAGGIVALVDTFYLGGGVVYLDHGAGLVSAYLHLSGAEVEMGDIVAAGQRIGRVGATGRVTGPHLHWIVRYGGITVDPLSLLQLNAPLAGAPRGSTDLIR